MTGAFSAIETMPGEAVLCLARDILANESARVSTLEAQLATIGQPFDGVRHAVVLALNAACDVFAVLIACGQDDKLSDRRTNELVRRLVNQTRAAFLDDGIVTTQEAVEASEPEMEAMPS